MANSTIPNLVAVSVPALTDLFGVRQSGDARDKKLTVTQLLTLVPAGGDVTKVGTPVDDQLGVWTGDGTIEGSANFNQVGIELRSALGNGPSIRNISSTSGTVPSLVPRQGDSNTGVANAGDDRVSLVAGGIMGLRVIESGSVISAIDLFGPTIVTGSIRVTDAAGPAMLNEAASATNPTLNPNRADADSGIGQNAVDQVSIIGGGVELVRAQEVVGANQFIVSPGGIQDNAALPSLAFGDGDTGFYESFADTIRVSLAGVARWVFTGDSLVAQIGNGPRLMNEASLHTNPTLIPALGDPSTGIGGVTGDISLIVGGVERVRITSTLGIFTGDWQAAISGGPLIIDEAASGTNPTLAPNRSDQDTGIGWNAADALSLIAGGVELARLSDNAGAFILAGTDPAADGGDLDLSSGDSGVAATGDGGTVNILAGESLATAGDGGVVSIKSGAGITTGKGGDMLFEVGSGGASGPGTSGNFFVNTLTGIGADGGLSVPIPGLVSIYGIGRSGAGLAGNLELWAGYASGSGGGSIGGDLNLFGGGQGGGAGEGGNANLYGGESDTQPGDAEIEGGTATVGGIGGKAFVKGGPGFGTNFAGGFATVQGGLGIGTGDGGAANLRGGDSGSGATGLGGAVNLTGGLSAATDGDGGAINLVSGAGAGSGANGDISLSVGGTNIVYDEATDRLIQGAEIFAYQSEAGDVSKVGTPANNQVGIWTGDGTLEGDVDLTFDGTILTTGLTGRVRTGVGTTSQAAFGFTTEINTGIYRQGTGSLGITLSGSGNWLFQAGSFFANIADGPRMMFEAASATNPVFVPRLGDQDSGIGSGALDQVDLIAGGLSCMAVRETAAARQIGFYVTAPISLQTGVAVSAAAIHAALVALGLITA